MRFDGGAISVYDGGGYGRYLHAQVDAAWQEWKTTQFERAAWLWIATDNKPAEALATQAASAPGKAQVTVSTDRLQQRLDALRTQLAKADGAARREAGWQLAVAQLLQKHGRLREALELPAGQLLSGWTVIPSGDLRLILERRADGLVLLDLADASVGASLLGADSGLLFELTLRNAQTGEQVRLSSDRAWSEVAIREEPGKAALTLRWAKPQSATLGALVVTARVRTDATQQRLAWSLEAQGQANPWSIWQVRFPQLALAAESPASQLLLPQAAGVLKPVGRERLSRFHGKESNGQPVRLAVMCPTTRTWRERQHDIVMRLFNECGVQGAYMDQIAAAKPEWCFDAVHGHPLGGGSWWNEQGYWPLLDRIRENKPRDRILTTECNAEPFLRWFDGYLTWHWQYDGQVPLFPAVYGGAVQMFGRAYGAGPTKDLALRMKAAQQLVWGEQLGWLHPNIVREPENFAFFRDAVQLRWKLRRYFHAGQMARPPKLAGDIPNVTADWQWSGVWPVTTSALMSGAWYLPAEKRLVLFFANVSDQAITTPVQYDLREAGLAGKNFTRRKWTPQGESDLGDVTTVFRETVTFPPRKLWAWEIRVKE